VKLLSIFEKNAVHVATAVSLKSALHVRL